VYAQYGCGFTAPDGWRNFDASMTLRWERTPVLGRLFTKNALRFPSAAECGDIVKGLPLKDGSCKGIFASHVLEHLALEDFHKALENTKRALMKGGIFRLVVPDLQWAAKEYLASVAAGDATANAIFFKETLLGAERRARNPFQFFFRFFSNAAHLWMWDEPALKTNLARHGFTNIRRCSFGDCEDPMFNLVEDAGRFEHAVAMEARG